MSEYTMWIRTKTTLCYAMSSLRDLAGRIAVEDGGGSPVDPILRALPHAFPLFSALLPCTYLLDNPDVMLAMTLHFPFLLPDGLYIGWHGF